MTDLVIPTASPNPASVDWVPLGNTGSVPTTQPSVRVYRQNSQSIPASAWTALIFDTVQYDKGPTPHWVAGSPTRLTCQVAGTYAINFVAQCSPSSGGGYRVAGINVNGALVSSGPMSGATLSASVSARMSAHTEVYLNVGDYVEGVVFQDSGTSLSVYGYVSGTDNAILSMALLGGQQGPPGFASPPTYATTLPASPVDGQEAILVDNVTNPTYQWRFRWNAGSSSAYKWEFVGGVQWRGFDASNIGLPTAAWGSSVPSFTVPRSGEWYARHSANLTGPSGAATQYYSAPGLSSESAPGDTVSGLYSPAGGPEITLISADRLITAAAGAVVNCQVYSTAAGAFWKNRYLYIWPKRVS